MTDIQKQSRRHPSGRPRHELPYRRLSITREPRSEPMTPGLRRPRTSNAIGFHAQLIACNERDDE